MHKLIIEISDATYDQMTKQARVTNKTPVTLVTDWLQGTYGSDVFHSTNGHSSEASRMNGNIKAAPKTIHEILEAEGMLEPQVDDFSEFAMPNISLETARNILAKAGGPSLTEILDEQRGPKH